MANQDTAASTSSLHGKIALVTGGSSGIGAAIALQLTRKGIAALAVTYSNNSKGAEDTLAQCRSISPSLKTVAVRADVLDPAVGPYLIAKTLQGLATKRIDIVVNNAAVVDMRLCEPFADTTLEAFNKMMQGNVFAPMSIINASLPYLPPKGGRFINISSIASKIGNTDPVLVYGASKAALDSITRSLGNLLAIKTGATFNTINVGATRSGASLAAADAMGDAFLQIAIEPATVEKRIAEPEDIAMIVGFVASEEARWINGQALAANGGHKELLALQG